MVPKISSFDFDIFLGYKFLSEIRNLFPKVPIMGLSATLTPEVSSEL